MRGTGAVVILSAVLLAPEAVYADVLWQWSFGSEAGTFVTTGELGDTVGSGTFTITGFSVTASSVPAHVGAVFVESQPAQGFSWDGSQPTEFFRANGTFTNGSNFFHPTNGLWYGFVPAEGCLFDATEQAIFCDPLTVTPVSDVPAMPGVMLSLVAVGTILVALRILRSARQSAAA